MFLLTHKPFPIRDDSSLDGEDNIQAWKAAGGIGILFKSADQVINELSKLGL